MINLYQAEGFIEQVETLIKYNLIKMKKLNITQRKQRIIARGEHGNHCHVITGEVEFDSQGRIVVTEDSEAVLKHLIESDWLQGKETWTEEHQDISLKTLPTQVRHGDVLLERISERTYQYIPQQVFDPLTKRIESVKDQG